MSKLFKVIGFFIKLNKINLLKKILILKILKRLLKIMIIQVFLFRLDNSQILIQTDKIPYYFNFKNSQKNKKMYYNRKNSNNYKNNHIKKYNKKNKIKLSFIIK